MIAQTPSRPPLSRTDDAEPTADSIAAVLEEEIVIGWLGPRARLVEDDLMSRFAAKRYVVREALSQLVNIGIAVRIPNRGVSVRHFELDEVEQVYFVRELLQREAARLVPLPGSRELVTRLRSIQRGHAAAVEAANLRAILRLNNDFHDELFGASGNAYLLAAIRHHAQLIHAIRSYRLANPVMLAQARDEHDAMIDAIEAGDRERLVRLCVDHIQPSKQAYITAFRRALERTAEQ